MRNDVSVGSAAYIFEVPPKFSHISTRSYITFNTTAILKIKMLDSSASKLQPLRLFHPPKILIYLVLSLPTFLLPLSLYKISFGIFMLQLNKIKRL
jgi:hypothetical protein